MTTSSTTTELIGPAWLQVVARQVAAIHFGVVQIVVHDHHVVQVETTEKIRFDVRSEAPVVSRDADRRGGTEPNKTRLTSRTEA